VAHVEQGKELGVSEAGEIGALIER